MDKLQKRRVILSAIGVHFTATANEKNSSMADSMAEYFGNTVEENVVLLKHLKRGFTNNDAT